MRVFEAPLRVIGRYIDLSRINLRAAVLRWAEQASAYLLSTSAHAVTNIFSLAVDFVVAFFTLFFLFRDGNSIRQRLASILPLAPEHSVRRSILLILGGHWLKALILIGWGAAIVGQVDALVRPYVISGRVKVHTLLVFFALLGGVKAFGVMGLFIGPVVLSVTIAVLGIFTEMSVVRGDGRQEQQPIPLSGADR